MKSVFKTLVAMAIGLSLTACTSGGGGGSVSTGGTYYTHDQLAAEFVRRVNVDVAGYSLSLVKSTTQQFDYIVVYDNFYRSYDAYYIGAYSVGANLSTYLFQYQYMFYYNLIPQGYNSYWDPISGIVFEKVQPGTKNLATMKALREEVAIKGAANNLRVQYGMSEEKSLDAARFAYKLKTAPPGTYNVKDFDAFAKELTGSSITEFQQDAKDGNMASLSERMNKAAEVTGMGSEGVNKLINEMFSQK